MQLPTQMACEKRCLTVYYKYYLAYLYNSSTHILGAQSKIARHKEKKKKKKTFSRNKAINKTQQKDDSRVRNIRQEPVKTMTGVCAQAPRRKSTRLASRDGTLNGGVQALRVKCKR